MPIYRIEFYGPPGGQLRERRNIQASDDEEAVRIAAVIYDRLAADASLSHYLLYDILYDSERLVHERAGKTNTTHES